MTRGQFARCQQLREYSGNFKQSQNIRNVATTLADNADRSSCVLAEFRSQLFICAGFIEGIEV